MCIAYVRPLRQNLAYDLRSEVVGDVPEYLVFRGKRIVEKIPFNYFNVSERTKPLAQTVNQLRILFDSDHLLRAACEYRGEYSVSGADFVDEIAWPDVSHANQPPGQPRTSQEVLRETSLPVLPCFHVHLQKNCGETKTRFYVEGLGQQKSREPKRY